MPNDTPAASRFCTKTRRVLIGAVQIDEGQHLHYFITVEGSAPIFTLACEHKPHFAANELGPPRQNYDIVWPRSSADEPGQDGDTYTFGMSFAGADMYTLRVELHNEDHELVGDEVIVDADYAGTPAATQCNESFVVRT
jgi:hypothetical protein